MNIINGIAYFRVSELLKQSRPGVHLKPLELKPFPLGEKLCVVKSLEEYIHRAAHLRDSTDNLFITYIKPHGRASKDTIARWKKQYCPCQEYTFQYSRRIAQGLYLHQQPGN